MSEQLPSVFVAIPTNAEEVRQDVLAAADVAALKARHMMSAPHGRFVTRGQPRDWNRNRAVRLFLDHPDRFSHMLWIDSDTVVPENALADLLAADKPVASGLQPLFMFGGLLGNCKLKDNPDGSQNPWPDWITWQIPKDPYEIGFCGFGCVLVRRDVFDRIEAAAPPVAEQHPGYGRLHSVGPWFVEDYGDTMGKDLRTEDIWFNMKCQELGIEQWCVPSVVCGHFKNVDLRDWYPKAAIRLNVETPTGNGD